MAIEEGADESQAWWDAEYGQVLEAFVLSAHKNIIAISAYRMP